MRDNRIHLLDLLMIALGCAFYGYGLVNVNIANNLAEGGVTGITLILRYWFHIDPAYSTVAINIPLILIGYRYLGKKSLFYTVYGTLMLSLFLWIWQRVSLPINLSVQHDMFLAGVLAGTFGGLGSGLIYRFGGTTGGTDVIARILEKTRKISMGKTILALDVVVMTLSLSYLNLRQMMYTLLCSFVFSRIVDFIQEGAYSDKGLFIFSSKNDEISSALLEELDRGVSFLKAEGAYSGKETKAIYCVINATEITQAKNIISAIDKKAFISIMDVNEVLGEGFTFQKK
ncbi:Uncharacterized membrane-anchored protein YitT, contains DUF161 and DUF2179 domains [Ligilactobacillus sp. WC1T17]|uniref:Uncharacterized membrane-anchored protein YitT, contains DUF161 and DUF2179 domains n=2 Tax=Ligilactobacillus TaxID=2767887 RepID=A0ABY1AA45_9LACO|nr:Uncharacterized membrane-anchored protein YitT, contains DUF161 and DUF2179 domains [Ligilactobacillus ruminis]